MLTWGGQRVRHDELLSIVIGGRENHRHVLCVPVHGPPLRGVISDDGAAVAGAHLDRLSTDDSVDIPAKFPGFSRDQAGFHMHGPPRRSVEVLAPRNLDLFGQRDGHCAGGTVIRGVSDDHSGRSRHRDGTVVTVRAEFFRHGDDDRVSRTMTLFEGQSNRKPHRLVGGELHRTILSLEECVNFPRRNILVNTRSVGSARRRLSVVVGGDRYRSSGVAARLGLDDDAGRLC